MQVHIFTNKIRQLSDILKKQWSISEEIDLVKIELSIIQIYKINIMANLQIFTKYF